MDDRTLMPENMPVPDPIDVRNSVSSVVNSGVFGKSERRADLLQYLVEKELSGRGGDIKAYSIALDVLGRDETFEASTDSIVRSEVGRLRDALKLYFASNVDAEQVRIEIPKGTYRPVFHVPEHAAEPVRSRPIWPAVFACIALISALFAISNEGGLSDKPTEPLVNLPYEVIRVSVDVFEGSGPNANIETLAFGVYSEIVMELSVYPWISVVSPPTSSQTEAAFAADYVLSGDLFWEGDTVQTHAELTVVPTNDVIWSSRLSTEAQPETLKKGIIDIGGGITSMLASVHGIAPELARSKTAQVSQEGLDAFLCYLGVHRYLASPNDADHLALRDCLLDSVTRHPSFGDGWAALAILYMDESRFERNIRPQSDPWENARLAIDKALKYAPARMPTLNAALIYSIEAPSQDLAEFERLSGLLLNLFPRHPPTLYNVGSRMAEFRGQWDEGQRLIDQALALEPHPPTSFFLTNAYKAALAGSEKEALFSVQKLQTSTSKSELLLNYIAAARNNLLVEMAKYRDLLGEEGLVDKKDILMHVQDRRYTPPLEEALLDQLEAAFEIEESIK